MGGLQLPELVREEEQAYNAQSIVLPLRRLAASSSTEAEHDALVGGGALSTQSTAEDVPTLEHHAKEVREAQQDALKERTGDTLYPASSEAICACKSLSKPHAFSLRMSTVGKARVWAEARKFLLQERKNQMRG